MDLVCKHGLADLLGGYDVQTRGESALDPYIDRRSLEDLPAMVHKYVAAHPRRPAPERPPS